MTRRRLFRDLRRYDKTKTKKEMEFSGLLGIGIGGRRRVEVPNRNGFVYVRLRNNTNELIQAFNEKVSPVFGLPVIVKWEVNRYVVLGRDSNRYASNWGSYSAFLPRHGPQHSLNFESGQGGDVTWVYSRQFMPMASIPSGTDGGSVVYVPPHVYRNPIDASWNYVGDQFSPDLTAGRPTGSFARMFLLYWDLNDTSLHVLTGSYFDPIYTGTNAILPYVPSIYGNNQIPLSAIRVVSGTVSIGWDNIYDVRQFSTTTPPSFAGGFGVWDEGIPIGTGTILNFVGPNVDASISGSVVRVFVTGSTGGGGVSTGATGSIVVVDYSGNVSTTQPWLKWGTNPSNGNEFVDFGADVSGKETNAGRIGYQTFTSNKLDIVGAGTGVGLRNVQVFDNLYVGTATYLQGTLSAGFLGTDSSGKIIAVASPTGSFDNRYLMLDTSNDPLTGSLDIVTSDFNYGLYIKTPNTSPIFVDQIFNGEVSDPVVGAERYSTGTPGTYTEAAYYVRDNAASATFRGGTIRHLSYSGTSPYHPKVITDINPYANASTGTVFLLDSQTPINVANPYLLFKRQGQEIFRVNASGTALSNNVPLIKEAPSDGNSYVRKNAGWEVASAGGGGAGNVVIYDDSEFIATGTKVSFNRNLTVTATGTSVFVEAPITTYFRVGQPTQLSGNFWRVPDRVYASGSLGVFHNGMVLVPTVDYVEQIWVSGTYQYLSSNFTGTHVVHYGVPCSPQTHIATGTSGSPFDLLDSDSELLNDSDNIQLLDSDGA